MDKETMAGQRHRRGVLWVITGLGCEGSQVEISKVAVSNEIG